MFSYRTKGTNERKSDLPPHLPSELQVARDIARKAASDIAVQAEFASLDAAENASLGDSAKRFDAIRHYAVRALEALERVPGSGSARNSVK